MIFRGALGPQEAKRDFVQEVASPQPKALPVVTTPPKGRTGFSLLFQHRTMGTEDIGGGIDDDTIEDAGDVPVHEVSPHPLHDHREAIALAF